MKILKKNQLIILVISLMLVTAGYLNFTSTQENKLSQDVVAELGDATLVSSNNVENLVQNNEEDYSKTQNEIVETLEQVDTYFANSKLERENMFSQMLATYQEVYNNSNSTNEQKNTALVEISKINEKRNAIMIAENLVKAKGFEDIVIFENSNSVSVIVKAEKIEPAQIAQIQNIISRELEVAAEAISISTK